MRLLSGALAVVVLALAGPATSVAAPKPSVVTLKTMRVGAAGNPSVGDRPVHGRDLQIVRRSVRRPRRAARRSAASSTATGSASSRSPSASGWPSSTPPTRPAATNTTSTAPTESSTAWPRFGQINYSAQARRRPPLHGRLPRMGRQALRLRQLPALGPLRQLALQRPACSPRARAPKAAASTHLQGAALAEDRGRHVRHAANGRRTRTAKTGFVIPSQDEWIKAAYYDPNGGGTYSYWKYPTNAGVFGDGTATAPAPTTLDPTNGNVTNATTQPLATYHAARSQPAPTWCPSAVAAASDCATVNPFGIDPTTYAEAFQGSLGTVGQALTRSPWGTLDQGGNAVEWTDTITPPPFGRRGQRVWRRLHGGIANAPVYQLWLSAVGLQPQDNTFFTATYPWLGIRIGVLGDLKPSKR